MLTYFEELKTSLLFNGISQKEAEDFFGGIPPRIKKFRKNDIIQGSAAGLKDIGIVIEGSALTIKEDAQGKNIILYLIRKGGTFGEAFNYKNVQLNGLYLTAAKNCRILYIPVEKLLDVTPRSTSAQIKMLKNIPIIISTKLRKQLLRTTYLLKTSARDKIISFLEEESAVLESALTSGDMNKTLLANYLNMDRTTLSKELSSMQKEGLILIEKNRIVLLKPA